MGKKFSLADLPETIPSSRCPARSCCPAPACR